MNLHGRRIQTKSLDPDTHNLLQLQFLEHPVQGSILRPAVHARIDGVPIAKPLRKAAPFAPVLGHIQNSIQELKVGEAYVAPLYRQAVFDSRVLLFSDFHLPLTYMS